MTRVVGPHEPGKEAQLRLETVDRQATKSLLGIELITGLPHQIRVQLSAIGHPVLGDLKYGAKAPLPGGNVALFAVSIGFAHPTKQTSMTVEAKPPESWPWP